MLHTLNKAWAKCLARRVDKKIMFVYSTNEELDIIIEALDESNKEIGDTCFCWVIDKNGVEEMMNDGIDFEMQDDILISHDIHYKIFLNDYLGRHCKRKCC